MNSQIQQNKIDILNKLGALDAMLESLGKIHKDDGDKADEMVKKISTRKLVLMEELYNLLSPLTP